MAAAATAMAETTTTQPVRALCSLQARRQPCHSGKIICMEKIPIQRPVRSISRWPDDIEWAKQTEVTEMEAVWGIVSDHLWTTVER